ncbi:hypothetical protein LINGRAHAP2_LOCUS20190 [Linum grandiflorum]
MVGEEEKPLIWKSEWLLESNVSVTLGRAMSSLLVARPRKLQASLSGLSPDSSSKRLLYSITFLIVVMFCNFERPEFNLSDSVDVGSLEEQLLFLHKYVEDAAGRNEKLDDVLIPIIQNSLENKGLGRGGQALLLVNWLFQDAFVFQAVAMNLADIIKTKDDRFISLGWCILVRNLVEYENFMDRYSLYEFERGGTSCFLILYLDETFSPLFGNAPLSDIRRQDGFELPSRLSVAAADCILAVSKALTKKETPNVARHPRAPQFTDSAENKGKQTFESSEVSSSKISYLLWDQIDILIALSQKLLVWNRKSRAIHSKGVELVLKWLQGIKQRYSDIQDEAGTLTSGTLLLSSCWKHYGGLLYWEDHNLSQKYEELLDQYVSGLQYYMENQAEDHAENTSSGLETRKFFLHCLCLLLGRLDCKRFESLMSEHWVQISRILLLQLPFEVSNDVRLPSNFRGRLGRLQ